MNQILQSDWFREPWSVRIEKNCALGLEHGPRPAASGRTQDLWHSFSQYGPPGRQIIYIYAKVHDDPYEYVMYFWNHCDENLILDQ